MAREPLSPAYPFPGPNWARIPPFFRQTRTYSCKTDTNSRSGRYFHVRENYHLIAAFMGQGLLETGLWTRILQNEDMRLQRASWRNPFFFEGKEQGPGRGTGKSGHKKYLRSHGLLTRGSLRRRIEYPISCRCGQDREKCTKPVQFYTKFLNLAVLSPDCRISGINGLS